MLLFSSGMSEIRPGVTIVARVHIYNGLQILPTEFLKCFYGVGCQVIHQPIVVGGSCALTTRFHFSN